MDRYGNYYNISDERDLVGKILKVLRIYMKHFFKVFTLIEKGKTRQVMSYQCLCHNYYYITS
jgi:hypothetical protein